MESLDSRSIFDATGRVSSKHKNYFPIYDNLFKEFSGRDITLVEIGVQNGGSLLMWKKILGPNARIIGVDLNPVAANLEVDGVKIIIGDQASESFWERFFEEIGDVDIVIDDGGHTYEQQIVTTHACLPRIRDGGMIIIEDTHTSYMKGFGYPSPYSFIEWAKHLVDRINARFPGVETLAGEETRLIHSIRFFESLVCLEINRQLCINNEPVFSKGLSLDANDFRYANIKEKFSILFNPEAPTGLQIKDKGLWAGLKRAIGKRVIKIYRSSSNRSLRHFFK
jgi:hypothetical protein